MNGYEGKTPWYVNPLGEKEMTINPGWLIQKYINDGRLVENKEEFDYQ